MPLNYQSIQDSQEEALKNLLGQRTPQLDASLAGISNLISGSRKTAFDSGFNPVLSSALGSAGLTATGSPESDVTASLQRSLEGNLAKGRISGADQNLGLQLNNLQRVNQSNQDKLRNTLGFARQQSALSQQEQFDAEQAQKDRDFQEVMDNLKQSYLDQGLTLQNQYANNDDLYTSAINRAFGSLLGTGASAFTLNAFGGGSSGDGGGSGAFLPATPTAGVGGYGSPAGYSTNPLFAGTEVYQ